MPQLVKTHLYRFCYVYRTDAALPILGTVTYDFDMEAVIVLLPQGGKVAIAQEYIEKIIRVR